LHSSRAIPLHLNRIASIPRHLPQGIGPVGIDLLSLERGKDSGFKTHRLPMFDKCIIYVIERLYNLAAICLLPDNEYP